VPERSDEPPQETAHTAVGTGAAARFWYLSSQHMTLGVVSAHPSDRVLEAPPIARRFVGQPLQSLRQWMSKQPGFRCELVGTGLLPVPEHGPAEAALLIAEDFPAGPSTPPGRGGSTAVQARSSGRAEGPELRTKWMLSQIRCGPMERRQLKVAVGTGVGSGLA